MLEIGHQLRMARENAGLSLDDMQGLTRIPVHELIALEEGRFESLHSSFTVRSYIRAYAAQVGLEPTYLLRQLRTTGSMTVPPHDAKRQIKTSGVSSPSPRKEHAHRKKRESPLPPPPGASDEAFTQPVHPKPLPEYPWYELPEVKESSLLPPNGNVEQTEHDRKRSRSRSFRWPVWVATAFILLLIPIGIWLIPFPSNSETTPSLPSESTPSSPTGSAEAAVPDGMILLDRTEKKSAFELVNNQDLVLEIKATDTCWVQIRENEDGGYLKDITLEKGDTFRFTHPQQVATDLWILLGAPGNVTIRVNGQEFKPTEVIHIDKK